MELAFAIVLSGVLLAAVVSFVVMGLRQRRRRRRLSGRAHAAGLLFAAEDPFDAPARYRGFVLMEAGHGPRAYNVTYGRMDGLPVRAFDFRYEVGHGTRRSTRHYTVVVAETGEQLPPMLLWNRHDADAMPLAARRCSVRSGPWVCDGPTGPATRLATDAAAFAENGGSIQSRGGTVMLCWPEGPGRGGRDVGIKAVAPVLRALGRRGESDHEPGGAGVEKPREA